ncbi:MAG TPA: NAD-dependent epimerase/dehydratase family protein [Bdellovibrionota bacterium]|nr:NAD-dependent epimerase/dehydratase family protein [Bdellovibrionota bacterium]
MARALVTGGAGFIGSNLVLELERLGWDVVVVDNLQSGRRENLQGFRGQVIEGNDLELRSLLRDELRGGQPFDGIFHHGDITDPRWPDDSQVLERNLKGFGEVVSLAAEQGSRLVYASTAGLYGNGPTPMKEDQPKQLLTAYGRSKLKMDEVAAEASKSQPIVGLRYFNVFGPREAGKGRPASMIYHLAQQMKQGKRPRLFKWGEQIRDQIYVKDVVAANLRALEAPSGAYNVGTGIPTSFNEIVAALNEALGTSLEPEYFDMPYDSTSYQANTLADTTLAEKKLGFKARWNFRDAVKDYMAWLYR